MTTRLQFLISAAEYRANIRAQKWMARHIARMEQLAAELDMESVLDDADHAFLRGQRACPIPNEPGKRGRPMSGRGLNDAAYAVLRTSRLIEDVGYLNPGGEGAPRKHDNATLALHVAYRMRFYDWKMTKAWRDVQVVYKVTKEQVRYAWDHEGDAASHYFGLVKK